MASCSYICWFSQCRVELGDIGVGMFRKLMTSLVESTMLYGAEIWGCNRNMEGVEQTQKPLSLAEAVGCVRLVCVARNLGGKK